MKKFVFLYLVISLVTIPAFAANYTIILDDGTTIECDSYREENGNIYYEGLYSVESMVNESVVVEIIDNLKEASIDNFVEKLREGDEDAIRELFEYAAMEFLEQIDGMESEYTTTSYYAAGLSTYKTKLVISTKTAKYSVDKTTSLLSPYEAKISFYSYVQFFYLGTETPVNLEKSHNGEVVLFFIFNEDSLKWEYREASNNSIMASYAEAEMSRFDAIQDDLIERGSQ